MIQTIRVRTNIGKDLRGENVLLDIKNILISNKVTKIETNILYRLEGITKKEAEVLAEKLLCENINQLYSINESLRNKSHHTVEIAYRPGVMNPEVTSIIKAAKDLGIDLLAADSSKEFCFNGTISEKELRELIEKLNLYNKTVEYIVEKSPQTLLIKGVVGNTTIVPIRMMSETKLLDLSKDKLFLNLEELKVIQKYFQKIKRDPTDCELETLAQTWSEHCAHKTFKASLIVDGKKKTPLIERIKKEALKHKKNIVSAFIDNSGVMDFFDGYAICGKAETHNSPSAIEPYGGAMTGSGGVFRDVVGTGKVAKTIASTDIFCFASPNFEKEKLPSGTLPPDYLLKRVVTGVKDYGNRMGIPTNNGSIHFHEDFRARPTIIVGAYGIIPKKYAQKGKAKKGDLVIALGGRTGRDGIHGATFSSGEMTDRTITVNSSAVQIGNAIEEKRMFDALIEARDTYCIRAIQDCGAGGFSSAIGEMGEDLGVTVNLEKAPLKYQGLSPWEIWISESQERMVCAIPKNKLKVFQKICDKYNVEYAVLGKFDGSKKLNVNYGKQKISKLDMQFLHHGLPQRTMIAAKPQYHPSRTKQLQKDKMTPQTGKDWIKIIQQILSHGNVCSKEPILRLYDHSVQGTSALQPFTGEKMDGPNDAVAIRPLLNKPYGMLISHGLNPILNRIDPYHGSIWAAVEALSNYVSVGGNYKNASLINNYIWPFPDEESLWSLDKSVDAVVDVMKAFKISVISGKDSLSSTYRGKNGTVIKIPPVLCMSVFGKIKDVSKTISSDFKKEGSVIVVVGKLDINGMGGSTYFDIINNQTEQVPQIDLKLMPQIFNSIYKGIQQNKILSCHDISEGGLLTSVFEMCVGGGIGATLTLKSDQLDYFLFNETAGCFVVEIENEKIAKKIFKNIPFNILGKTVKEKTITVKKDKKTLFQANIDELKKFWQEPMKKIFG